MPTYQYRCQDCDALHEAFQSFSDDALTVCPTCTGSLRKVFNSVGVVFKGSGFYRTDSRDTSSAAAAPKTESAKTESPKSESPKTESKSSAPAPAPAAS